MELLVVDGSSHDGTLDVLRRNGQHLTFWTSEPDRGQSHAINKGFARCTGDLVTWLCSDDRLAPGALHKVAAAFAADPSADVIAGETQFSFLDAPLRNYHLGTGPNPGQFLPFRNGIPQPSTFLARRLLARRTPFVREDLHYTMDWEMWCFLSASGGIRWHVLNDVLSVYTVTGSNKTFGNGRKMLAELERIFAEYAADRRGLIRLAKRVWLPVAKAAHARRGTRAGRALWDTARAVRKAMSLRYGYGVVAAVVDTYWLYAVEQAA